MADLRRLANELELLSDENRRELNAALITGGSTRYIADSAYQHGHDELAQKCADLERERDSAVAVERERLVQAFVEWIDLENRQLGLPVTSIHRFNALVERIRETSR
jgi:hypothetical protein